MADFVQLVLNGGSHALLLVVVWFLYQEVRRLNKHADIANRQREALHKRLEECLARLTKP
jgi:hypothetical protein